MELDDLNCRILNILCDEHVPNRVIAEELGVTEGAVRQRIKKLKESGAVKVKALRDPNILANQQLAIIAVSVAEARLLESKAQEVSKLPGVMSVSIVSGRYDLMVEVLVESNKGLVRFLTETLSGVQGISQTESFVILRSYNKFV